LYINRLKRIWTGEEGGEADDIALQATLSRAT
jgi:hypothetical protein